MSTPFPLEEQSASDRLYSGPMSDPWHGPVNPGMFAGLGYNEENDYLGPSTPILTGVGKAVSKVVAGAAGAASSFYGAEASLGDQLASAVGLHPDPESNPLRLFSEELARTQATAQKNVEALTPNSVTTGAAFQIVHGLSEGVSLAAAGGAAGGLPGAVGLTAATEGSGTYQEQVKAGVSPGVAATEAGLSAVTSGAGVLIPGGFGSTLASKLLTGAGAQIGLGLASRYADHKILEANGYPEMAAQQKVWDSTQVLTDALLGAAFGGLAHLHGGREAKAVEAAANEPGMVDAALVANLAARDRAAAPGVPVDPAAAHAHEDAHQTSITQLLKGEPNDVSGTGIEQARFLMRPVDEAQRLAEVHASIAEQLAQQRDQLVSDSAAFLRGNDTRAAERELTQHEATRREAQAAYEAIPEPKEAADLKPGILARMEAEDKDAYGEDWNSKQYAKLRQKAATKEAREAADVNQQVYMQRKADAQGHLDDIDERVARQRNEVARLTKAEESFKALRAHDAAIKEAGDDPAKLAKVISDERDRRTLEDQLKPMEPTEENLRQHIAENPDAAIGGYLNTETGQVHLDDIKQTETRPFRLSERDQGQTHGEGTRPAAGAAGPAAAGEPRGPGAQSPGATVESRAGAAPGDARLADTVRSALKERPDLKVPGEDGNPTSAAELLRKAQEEATKELSDFQTAVMAATSCFGRRGA